MIAILLENAPDALKGELTKWVTLVKPSVYIGTVNKRIREVLITRIQEENQKDSSVSAQIYFDAKNELGYEIVEVGNPQKELIDFQGLKLVSTISTSDQLQEIASLCWAKLNPYKSLSDHMFETGTIAKKFLQCTKYKALVPLFKEFIKTELNDDDLINMLSYYIALHDIGKCWPDFQLKAKDNHDYHIEREISLLEKQKMYKRFLTNPDHFRHEISSAIIIDRYLSSKGDEFSNLKNSLSVIYENHHLSESNDSKNRIREKEVAPLKWEQVQDVLIETMFKNFKPVDFELKEDKTELFNVLFLGFLYRCDWIASSLFSKEIHFDSYKEYTEYVNNTIDGYIKDIEIQSIPLIKDKVSFKDLFPEIPSNTLRPLQQKIVELMEADPKFDCLIIEDLTGSGKTESGLLAGINAMYASNKQGIFFGLPTNATEQAMNPRVQSALDSLYGDGISNVTHASGKSWIYDEILDFNEEDKIKRFYASERETKLLYPFSTGTVDQIERSVQLRKHMLISLSDLATKAVIIDEMHAYDMYMLGILEKALRWLKEFHVPVIIMSATLPDTIKSIIHSVYSNEKYIASNDYPLITKYSNNQYATYKVNAYEQREYITEMTQVDFENKELLYEIIAKMIQHKIEHGGNIVCILNSVNNAKGLFEVIKEKFPNIEKMLFIGRDTLEHKEQKSQMLVSKYGKDRSNRPEKSIVISTQIIEQSLDLDFDYMITELAPIDLLLQRFGRWQRHSDLGTIRENNEIKPSITVLYAQSLQDHKVYSDNIELLKHTVNYLKQNKILKIPETTREAINYVYSEDICCSSINDWAKAYLATIETPNSLVSLPWGNKLKLKADVPTRLEKYKTVEVCYVSKEEYDFLKENKKIDKSKAAKLKFSNTIVEYKNIADKLIDSFKGEGWMEDVVITVGTITNP